MISIGTHTIEGTGNTDPPKGEKVNFSIHSGVTIMLNLYSEHTAYRGVPTSARKVKEEKETRTVTMNYRGMVYTKQVEVAK